MKAVQIGRYGHIDALEVNDIPKPEVKNGQVLVKVYASSINPVDIIIREGHMASVMPLQFPITLGSDIAGVITEVGEGVQNLKIGNKVYGQAIVLAKGSGAFAEFAAVPATTISLMPRNIEFNEAAAAVLAGVSALQALTVHLQLAAGQKVLIHGGAGGIGTFAIQIAKHLGAHVTSTATGGGVDYVKSLGADEVVDYQTQAFEKILSGYDAVLDTVGGQTYINSFAVLKKGGKIVSLLMPPDAALMAHCGVTALQQMTNITTESLAALTQLIENNIIKIHVDRVYDMDHIKDAFEAKENGTVLGKIVIAIQ